MPLKNQALCFQQKVINCKDSYQAGNAAYWWEWDSGLLSSIPHPATNWPKGHKESQTF